MFPLALLIGLLVTQREPVAPRVDTGEARAVYYCAPSFDPAKMKEGKAPIFKGLGNLNYTITTSSPKAQQYFNQGLTLLYAFNHSEAGRSFKAAIKLDSSCAMAYWGMGMVLGPNYNAALNPTSLGDINDAMDKAAKYAAGAKPHEQALIGALRKRFPRAEVKDMTPYNAAYAAAMKEVFENYPADENIATLYADALMNEHPWNLWLKDGTPQPWTPAIVQTLEKLLAKSPNHPGANHMYIHAMEASRVASKALPSADKLRDMLPAAGHIVHMPSHIYIRTGNYHKGVIANEKASLADSNYVTQCKVQSSYALLLYPHNLHFLAACAFLEGNSKKAIDAAWKVSANADRKYLADNITVQHFYSIPFFVMVNLGMWNDILELPEPDKKLLYPAAVWHYARGMAFTGKGNLPEAEKELQTIRKLSEDGTLKSLMIWDLNSANDIVDICVNMLSGEIAAKQQNYDAAKKFLAKAVEIEDKLNYNEPPDWFFSVRLSLGHILLQAKDYIEAEKVFREDLQTFPENGWALMGLYKSLDGQQKAGEAKQTKARFDKAWQWSDLKINSSRVF